MVQMNRFAGQKSRHRCRDKCMDTKGGKWLGGWDELGDWD